MDNKYKQMSNSEIRIEMLNLENTYETKKAKISKLLEEMRKLDIEYVAAKSELDKRGANKWQ